MSTFPRVRGALCAALLVATGAALARRHDDPPHPIRVGPVTIYHATAHDESPPLATLDATPVLPSATGCPSGNCGAAPPADLDADRVAAPGGGTRPGDVPGAEVEQRAEGSRPALRAVASFDGLGDGFSGTAGDARLRNPSDNSLAVGPNHIVQIVNSVMAVYTRAGAQFDTTGTVLYGPVVTNAIFKGFGGTCEKSRSGDAVVRYDQLAGRWLYVLPIFGKLPGDSTYAMCYAVSAGPDPLGPYYRYSFQRPLFPDYPRPAVWPDGYYISTSTGDKVIQKHACVADRASMLRGLPATEQCVIIDGVNFLNNADVDGFTPPPAGAPNIILATGGTQLKGIFEDNALYAWQFHVDWNDTSRTRVTGPLRIPVAPYHYLCDGQLSDCVPQPDTNVRLDSQGDKLMQRVVYRNLGAYRSIVTTHSVNTSEGGGGVRWYEFRVDRENRPQLYQQSTFAPDSFYRWMASIDIDHVGDIGVGYSFGGTPNYPGQRFTARLANDSVGRMTFRESVLAEGAGSQLRGNRWEDYTTTAMDPVDDCTFWYVGDYYHHSGTDYATRIGAWRIPPCHGRVVSGSVFLDVNHNGTADPGEPGLAGIAVRLRGSADSTLATDATGRFAVWFSLDSGAAPAVEVSAPGADGHGLDETGARSRTIHLEDLRSTAQADFGAACSVRNSGGRPVTFWAGADGTAMLAGHDSAWRAVLDVTAPAINADGSRFRATAAGAAGAAELVAWLAHEDDHNMSNALTAELVAAALNVALGTQRGTVTVNDPVRHDWPAVDTLIARVAAFALAHPNTTTKGAERTSAGAYAKLLHDLNRDALSVTPDQAERCAR